mmetsp:Transcript_11048/g.36316  ORF Transcript_11048/g.36316 Transcript_11048/m.36316 type:complete len:83 (+) Transcript_11048:444-692(+)
MVRVRAPESILVDVLEQRPFPTTAVFFCLFPFLSAAPAVIAMVVSLPYARLVHADLAEVAATIRLEKVGHTPSFSSRAHAII